MSVTSKKLKHNSKMARKRAEKAAKRAKYLALAGTSKKAKRQRRTGERGKSPHAVSVSCGNVGCPSCNSRLNVNRFHGASRRAG